MASTYISPNDVLRVMVGGSDLSGYRISLDLGRTRNWISNSLGRDPMLSTVAEVAEITGHKVAILDAESGETVAFVRPPERDAEPD